MGSIFVQIASYRDPELKRTITDCLSKAEQPEKLLFGICWQHDEFEHLGEFENDGRFRILDYPWQQSRGVAWARQKTQELYSGEDFTLQIDSHTRFAKKWDKRLAESLLALDSEAPILTTYPAIYRYVDGKEQLENTPAQRLIAERFNEDGSIVQISEPIDNIATIDKPVAGIFLAAGFLFTLGRFCEEVKYDPDLYFTGEELYLNFKAFTYGYDIYHPHENYVWHLYARKEYPKHWQDHTKENKKNKVVDFAWEELQQKSAKKLRSIFYDQSADLLACGFGNKRTLREYEHQSGLDFKRRTIRNDGKK